MLVAGSGAATVLEIAQGRTDSPRVVATLAAGVRPLGPGDPGRHLLPQPSTPSPEAPSGELLAEGVEASDELKRQAGSPIIGAVAMLENVAVVVFLYLMVSKPGA